MADKKTYAIAVLFAGAIFAVSGGIQASETAVKAEEAAVKSAPTQPAPRALGVDASIAFANAGGIQDWHPDGTKALFVQDRHGLWYHATLMTPCFDIVSTEDVAFITRGPDDLDKFSSVQVRGQRCQFDSFVTSAAPPAKTPKPHEPKGEAPKG